MTSGRVGERGVGDQIRYALWERWQLVLYDAKHSTHRVEVKVGRFASNHFNDDTSNTPDV